METLKELPKGSNSSTSLKSGKQRIEACSICLESISERAIAVPCNHATFDFICLVSWLQEHPTCPLCKTSLTAVEYDFAGPDDFSTFHLRPPNNKIPDNQTRPPRWINNRRRRRNQRQSVQDKIAIYTSEDPSVDRRRRIYREQLYSYHVGTNRMSQFKDFTHQVFRQDTVLQKKARAFIKRELMVFDFDSVEQGDPDSSSNIPRRDNRSPNTEFLLEYIVAVLKSADVKDSSGKAESFVGKFLGSANARLFLHELNAFLRSPYMDLHTWDRHVQYQTSFVTGQ